MNNITTIFGAPGTGKTTYLINLLMGLIKDYRPNEIAYVSFTRKGSYEGRDRACETFKLNKEDFPYFRTIHSICFRELGVTRYEMIGKRYYKEFSNAMGMNFLGYYTEELINNDDKYLFQVSLEKNNEELARAKEVELDLRKYKFVKNNYERFKHKKYIKDFDDLLIEYYEYGKPLPIKIAIIDEAQDLTTLQWKVCQKLFANCEKVFIAGDDDQAIYEWSGADVNKFLDIARRNKMIILDKSYRLKKSILEYSKNICKRIDNRIEKEFEYDKGIGSITFYNDLRELTINSEQTYYFLSRNNMFLKQFKERVIRLGCPFKYKGIDYAKKSVYNAIKEYEYLRKEDPLKIRATLRIVPLLKKDFKMGIPWYEAFNLDEEEMTFWRDFFAHKSKIENPKIEINTIHGVKGGEADNVVLTLNVTRNVHNAIINRHTIDSELRCLYVAITRAKTNLHIINSNSRYGYEEANII